MAITAVVLWLDINYARHAGALWRDEANSLSMATYPSLSVTWDRLQFDSFPILWYVVLRSWVGLGLGQTDGGFRLFGLIVNLGILGVLWLNAWRISRRPPIVALILFGANAAVMMFCGSIRGYGLGVALGLWMYGSIWAYLMRPTALRWTAALVAAVLACHMLYYNCIFVAAACLAGASVAISHRNLRVTASMMAIASLTAATLLVYLPTFRNSDEWRSIWLYPGGLSWLWFKFVEAITLGHRVMQPIWVIVSLCTPLAGLLIWIRARKVVTETESDRIHVGGQPDLALFAAVSVSIGVMGNILFLRLLNYYMQPWYFLSLMTIVAAGADDVHRAARIGKGFRVFGVAFSAVVLMLILFSPLYTWSMTRRTNLDEIARLLEQSATKGDYIVVTDWTHGVTFHRYYSGSTQWQTLPPLPADAHEIHRSDLVFNIMRRGDAIRPVLDAVAQTLHDGHRVFYIGHLTEPLPSEDPNVYFVRRVKAQSPPSAMDFWSYELNYTVHELASHVTRIPINLKQPISSYEDLDLTVVEGWRPSP